MSPPPQRPRRRRTTLGLALVALVAAGAGLQAWRWFPSPLDPGLRSPSRPSARTRPPATTPARPAGSGSPAAIDPNLPLYSGATRRLAAQAIDDTARSPLNQALIALARRFLGRPSSPLPREPQPSQRLLLDLEQVDQLRFVEQLLALVNSRQVATRTEAVDRFSDHVRQLRYRDGQVADCRRHPNFSLWAQAAERQGYLVNLTPFLPGASRRHLPLTVQSSQAEAAAARSPATQRHCLPTPGKSQTLEQVYVPLQGLEQVLPSLRKGDIYALVSRRPGLDISQVGLVDIQVPQDSQPPQIHTIHAGGSEVMRSLDLAREAGASDGVIGLSIYRPVPNPDGQPDR